MDSSDTFRSLDAKISKIDDKVDRILDHTKNTDITLIRQNEELKYHIKRSDQLEKYVSLLEEEIKPIKKTMVMIQGALKAFGGLAVIVSLVAGVYKIYELMF